MTTPRFNTMAGPTARAMAAVKGEHCQPPTYRPAQAVSGSMPCPRCGGSLKFTVAPSGTSTGRCTSAGCVRWVE